MDNHESIARALLDASIDNFLDGDGIIKCCVEAAVAQKAAGMLKAQEPRLITKDDFENADAWGAIPAWIEHDPAIEGADSGWAIVYSEILGSKLKKAWTSRPTDEQLEKVKWE